MGFIGKARSGGARTEVPPAGSHGAICIALVDLGTHTEFYKGKDGKPDKQEDVRKVFVAWELTDCPLSGTKEMNHVVGLSYNVKYGPKAGLRQMLEKWRGKQFQDGEDIDLEKVLGAKCLVTITHGTSSKGNTYGSVDGIGPVPAGMAVKPSREKTYTFYVDGDDDFKPPVWLPDWLYGEKIADIIGACHEWNHGRAPSANSSVNGQQPAAQPQVEDIPF